MPREVIPIHWYALAEQSQWPPPQLEEVAASPHRTVFQDLTCLQQVRSSEYQSRAVEHQGYAIYVNMKQIP